VCSSSLLSAAGRYGWVAKRKHRCATLPSQRPAPQNLDLREGRVKDGPIGPLDCRLQAGQHSVTPPQGQSATHSGTSTGHARTPLAPSSKPSYASPAASNRAMSLRRGGGASRESARQYVCEDRVSEFAICASKDRERLPRLRSTDLPSDLGRECRLDARH
jgi:hypothetical protein